MQHLQFLSMTNLFSCTIARLKRQLSFPSHSQGKWGSRPEKKKKNKLYKRHYLIQSTFCSFNIILLGLLISNHCSGFCGKYREKWQYPCPSRIYRISEESDSMKILNLYSIFACSKKSQYFMITLFLYKRL